MPTTTFTPIATTTLNTTASSISISSIPSTYTHLFGSLTWAGDTNNISLQLRVNDINSASYCTKGYRFNNNTFSTSTVTDDTQLFLGFGTYTGTNPRMSNQFYIYNYKSSLVNKSTTMWGSAVNSNPNASNMNRTGGLINLSNVINKITIFQIGSFNADTTFTLYGLV